MHWNGLTITLTIFCVLVVSFLILRARKKRRSGIQGSLEHPGGFKKYHKDTRVFVRRALESSAKKVAKKSNESSPEKSIALLTFKGDIHASDRHALSRSIDEVLLNKEKLSEVVIKVESPGGSVTDYGHVYGEVMRLREGGLVVTACVDTVAASGGYLMCLPANRIVAAPFAMVGSIGVVSFIPNIRKLLEKLSIEPRTFTAGDYKRTVTLTDDASPEQIQRFNQQLQLIHDQFKQALSNYRSQVDLARVATGEAWLASTTMELDLKLVDEIGVSSDYLLKLNQKQDLVEFSEKPRRRGLKDLFGFLSAKFLSKVYELATDNYL